ncbi:MAG: YfbM family protein [Gemmataceae bacterium]
MACLGVHFAITRAQMEKLLRAAGNRKQGAGERDEAVLDLVQDIEEKWDGKNLFETDKAWDGIHRCLTEDNTPRGRIDPRKGSYPLKLCIMGGTRLYAGNDYSVNLIDPGQVADLAKALKTIDEEWMRERFFRLKPKATLYAIDEDEFEYVWGNFQGLPQFFAQAAKKKRAVVFTVDH